MKTNSLIVLFLILFAFYSCEKTTDKTDDPAMNGGINNTPDNAPDKIIGKALVLYNAKMQYTLQASGFASNSTCDVVMIGGVYKLIGTPSYTYSKSTATKAKVEVKYSDQFKVGLDYTNSNRTYTADLSFTSESEGSYTGTEKAVCNSSVAGLNGTTTRTISGTFTLY